MAQIARQVAQNVHQLQPFAEPHALGRQPILVQKRVANQVRATHFRPELANAAGDTVSVIVQFLIGVQGGNALECGVGEAAQVQLLAAGDDGQHIANALPVFGRKLFDQRHGFLGALQQTPFGGRVLVLRQRAEIQGRGRGVGQNPLAQRPQRLQPFGGRNDLRVRDGVGRARQQIGEADLWTDRAGQHAQSLVKRARDLFEQFGQQPCRRIHHFRRPLFSAIAPVACAFLWCPEHRECFAGPWPA